MSFDKQGTPVATNINTLPPKKSGGALKWILGGCGCLGLIALLCVGGLTYFAVSTAGQVTQEARSFIEGSTVAQEYLGSPITINGEPVPTQTPGGGLVFDFDVSGPKGSGTAKVKAKMNPETFQFEMGESSLDFNGETIDLNAENEFMDLEVEELDMDN